MRLPQKITALTALDYLYFAISLIIILAGIILLASGALLNNLVVSDLGGVLVGTGIVSGFVEKVLHKQLESLITERLEEHLGEFALKEACNGAGVTNLIGSRQDYHGRPIHTYVRSAQHNLIMTGTAFKTGIQFEGFQNTLKEMAQSGIKVVICLVNPDDANAMATLARSLNNQPGQLSGEIHHAIDVLVSAKRELVNGNQQNLLIKVHNAIPFASGILIDALAPSKAGTIQVEIKPYKSVLSDAFGIEVKGSNDYIDNKTLYKTLRESWLKLLDDGREVR